MRSVLGSKEKKVGNSHLIFKIKLTRTYPRAMIAVMQLTAREARELLGVDGFGLYLERLRGLPHTKISTKFYTYNLDEVIEWKRKRSETNGNGLKSGGSSNEG